MSLGENISRRRKELGLSQEALGERLGVSCQAVSKWETGKALPDMENLLALATLFGVPVSELTGTPPEETAAVPEPPSGRGRFWAALVFGGLALLLLLSAALPILLFGRNRADISDKPVEFQAPVEELDPPEVPDPAPALPEPDPAPLEPEGGYALLSDAQIVYQAFNRLAAGNDLTAEERYAYRGDLITNLSSMDWTEFGRLGTTDEISCISALTYFLTCLEDYSETEIYYLQRASIAKGLDGAFTEDYANTLSSVLFRYPAAFARQLAYDDSSGEPWPYWAIMLSTYGLSYFPEKVAQVEKTLESALSDGSFTEEQSGWCRLLLLYLEETDGGELSGLPKTPEEMQD